MEYKYRNIMEILVEDTFESLRDALDCCDCEQCRSDIISCALNHIPPQYVVTHEGLKIGEIRLGKPQALADLRSEVLKAARVVRENPHHSRPGDMVETRAPGGFSQVK